MTGEPNGRFLPFSFSVPLAAAVLLTVSSIFVFFSSHSSSSCPFIAFYSPFSPNVPVTRKPDPNAPSPVCSLVASLEKFLTSRPSAPSSLSVTSASDGGDILAKGLDDKIWRRETNELFGDRSNPWSGSPVVKVYVYEMPDKFTYDLLRLFRDTYISTTNLTSNGSPVHRLIEQHSVDYWLWADLIAPESERLLKNVVRVDQQEEADLFYIPFFTTISYFLLEKQQCKALYRVWKFAQGFVELLQYNPDIRLFL